MLSDNEVNAGITETRIYIERTRQEIQAHYDQINQSLDNLIINKLDEDYTQFITQIQARHKGLAMIRRSLTAFEMTFFPEVIEKLRGIHSCYCRY